MNRSLGKLALALNDESLAVACALEVEALSAAASMIPFIR
jgi:hypothetical protein